MSAAWDSVNRTQWAKTRQIVFDRDGRTCAIGYPGCTQVATQVDHIVPVSRGGSRYDPLNCRPACVDCNKKRNAFMPPTGLAYTSGRF